MSTYEQAITEAAEVLGLGDKFQAPDPEIMDKIFDCFVREFGESPEAWYGAWSATRTFVLENMDQMVRAITAKGEDITTAEMMMIFTHFTAIIGAFLIRMQEHPALLAAIEARRR